VRLRNLRGETWSTAEAKGLPDAAVIYDAKAGAHSLSVQAPKRTCPVARADHRFKHGPLYRKEVCTCTRE